MKVHVLEAVQASEERLTHRINELDERLTLAVDELQESIRRSLNETEEMAQQIAATFERLGRIEEVC
ncbi:hypothetical protein OS242_13170 [Tumebacillus sp. DT12]|uniref:Uncharacterized protein n=1 Tax=Tumebacillus lacus TaxID=2995335 RepID=A0ABT3X5N6_9BACL|nr:hypothetical protein [Tumebacillus lacus]MCX7570895.1 hypothetical protein [Tumebacillus lacus]